ncbi:hypothetical protein VKT23_002939 [Stygiomarasmius scandens]|uniref:Uncharacterized protein n=1 Tax=Marasmiellus scandens TaxID=2682957 RepID=A0ABR1JZW5_9AGAR
MRDKKKRLGFVLPARRNFDLLSKPPDVETGEVEHLKYEADNAASYESDIGYGAIKQTEKPEELDMHPIVQYRWSTTSDVYSAWNDRSVAASANSDDDRAAVTFAGTRNERKTSDITDDDSQGKEMVALVDTDSDRALSGDEDACSKLWAVYIGEAGKYNKDLMISWKQDMEGLLIFVCVYAPGS